MGRYAHTFVRVGKLFSTWYQTWAIILETGEVLYRKNITQDSSLAHYLSNLLGHRDYLELDEHKRKIFETIFNHTRSWKLFRDAEDILMKEGTEESLKMLEDKFAIVRMMDELEQKRNF